MGRRSPRNKNRKTARVSSQPARQQRAGADAKKPETETDLKSRRSSPVRLAILTCILIVLGLGVWFSGQAAALPRQWARKAVVEKRMSDAAYWLTWANRLALQDPRNAMLAARIERTRGDAKQMREELNTARRWGADEAEVQREIDLAVAQAGQLDSVEAKLFDMLRLGDPEPDEVSAALANGLAAAGRYDEALSVIAAWQEDFPRDPRCDYRIGRIMEHQERYDDAETYYKAALQKAPKYYSAAFSLGRVLLNQRRVEEALEMYQRCLSMTRPDAAKIEMAVALKALGRSDEARPLLQEVLESDRDQHMQSYASVDEQPEGFRAAAEYGRLESDAGNFEAALPWLKASLRENPLDLTVRYALGVTLRGLGQLEEAEQEFEHVRKAREAMGPATGLSERIKRDPADVEARFQLGKLILENESEKIGLYWIQSVFAHDPMYAPAHALLAQHYAAKAAKQGDDVVELRRLAQYHQRAAQATPATDDAN